MQTPFSQDKIRSLEGSKEHNGTKLVHNDQLAGENFSMNFHIHDQSIDEHTHVIELGGEVDLYTAPELKELLLSKIKEEGKTHIVVDLSQTTFIDSTTLGVLISGVRQLRKVGGALALVCSDENIVKIFEITGLDKVFPICKTREEALAKVAE